MLKSKYGFKGHYGFRSGCEKTIILLCQLMLPDLLKKLNAAKRNMYFLSKEKSQVVDSSYTMQVIFIKNDKLFLRLNLNC